MTIGEKIVREVQRMSASQAVKVLRSVRNNADGQRVLASLIRKRHHRRTRRLMQSASRARNR